MNALRHLTFCLLLTALPTALQATPKTIRIAYHYAPDGTLAGKSVNGRRLDYTQDARGQLIAAAWADGAQAEQHHFDPAGNRLAKTVDGETTRYTYDDANQLVSSVAPDGSVTRFRHDAAGRLVLAGDVAYRHDAWGRVTEIVRAGVTAARLEYGIDGQLSRITRSDGTVEEFVWDGLALVWRSGVAYVNEPAPTGGNPILAGDAPILTDILGSSAAIAGDIIDMSAFGETARHDAVFTGKPYVEGLGYVFLLRNYCPRLGRWSAADPLGYPDGWNSLAYGNNQVMSGMDIQGLKWVYTTHTSYFNTELYMQPAYHVQDEPPYEPIFYIGNANGGNRGVALQSYNTYANFRNHFPDFMSVPTQMIQENWLEVSIGSRHLVVMTSFDDQNCEDSRSFIGTDPSDPNQFWFKLYSVEGYATYKFTYKTRIWE